MAFASTQLAEKIEAADRRSLIDVAMAAAQRRGGDDVFWREFSGGVGVFVERDSPLNKLVGLGFAGLPSVDELAELEELFSARGAKLHVEVSSLAHPRLFKFLAERGYQMIGFEDLRSRCLGPEDKSPAFASHFEVRRAEPSEQQLWIDTIVDGFLAVDGHGAVPMDPYPRASLERGMLDSWASPSTLSYLAFDDGAAVGAASMRVDAVGVAQFAGAATLREHRGRGVQTALLRARMAAAAKDGCSRVVVVTAPGSKSAENVTRLGFDLLYARAVMVRHPEP